MRSCGGQGCITVSLVEMESEKGTKGKMISKRKRLGSRQAGGRGEVPINCRSVAPPGASSAALSAEQG